MLPYLFVSIPLVILAVLSPSRRTPWLLWTSAFIVLVAFVGLRHHVGMDWNNYILMIHKVTWTSLDDALAAAEPAYAFILRQSGQMGYGVYGANLVVALILMAGLFRYARTTPRPWMALVAALPFLVVVVGMSANRQAAAIGVLLWAVAGWDRYSLVRRTALVGLAALFHFSAILFLLFVAADLKMRFGTRIFMMAIMTGLGLYILDVSGRLEYYDSLYVSGGSDITVSSGAFFHTLLNAGPALVYFLARGIRTTLLPNQLHRNMALMAVCLVPLAFVTSAAAGRFSLYLFPVSMYVFAAIPEALHGKGFGLLYKIACTGLFVFVMVFWLVESNSGFSYLPYKNLLLIYPSERELCC